jgi:hypothetical protein
MPRCVCHPSGIALFLRYPALKRWAKLFRASGAGFWKELLARVHCSRESYWLGTSLGRELLAGVHCDDALDGAAADGTERIVPGKHDAVFLRAVVGVSFVIGAFKGTDVA